MPGNKPIPLDLEWIKNVNVKSDSDIKSEAAKFTDAKIIEKCSSRQWLRLSIQVVDLAALVGNETPEDVKKLCSQAASPLAGCGDVAGNDVDEDGKRVSCAAVCLYPARIEEAVEVVKQLAVENYVGVAAVAAGFPSGQFPLHSRLAEIYYAVACGATEIDVVIDRSLVLRQLWSQLYDELVQMRKACGTTCLKVILSVTECGNWSNVYRASLVAMMAGADFIKTSTGKEAVTASINDGYVMCLAIKDFYKRTSVKVGLKPAGGIRSADHAISWLVMVKETLGEEWVNAKYFRIGTSGTSSMIPSVGQALAKS